MTTISLRQRKDERLQAGYYCEIMNKMSVAHKIMPTSLPTAQTTVADLLEQWPQTIPVFQKRGMACVGCPFAPFVTLKEAAKVYQLDLSTFLNELEQAVPVSKPGARREKQRKL